MDATSMPISLYIEETYSHDIYRAIGIFFISAAPPKNG